MIGGDVAEVGSAQRGVDIPEVGVVKDIEGLDAQLDIDVLADLGVFRQSDVPLLEARSKDRARAQVTERTGSGSKR